MNEIGTIGGSAELTLRDHIDGLIFARPSAWLAPAGVVLCGGLVVALVAAAIEVPLLKAILAISIIALASIASVICSIFYRLWLSDRKLGPGQRRVAYEMDSEQIFFNDATGAISSIPWTNVTWAAERQRGYAFGIRPQGSRWIPKRAFSPKDRETIAALMRLRAAPK